MSVTASNYHFCANGWHSNSSRSMMIMTATAQSSQSLESSANSGTSPNVDDGLTSLSWLQNLNMCMTRLGAPTPPTPPASPISTGSMSGLSGMNGMSGLNGMNNTLTSISSNLDGVHTTSIQKVHTIYQSHREKSFQNGHTTTSTTNSNKKMSQTNNESESIDYKTNGNIKPPYSYATLICMAMKANKNKMTLSAIYKWIRENFMYYKNADPSWQNSIRHNLSLNKCFIKIPRNKDEPGKGGFWRLDPVYADTLVDGVFKKRRPCQRGSNSTSNNTNAPFKKKSRKKEQLKNDSSISSAINDGNNGVTTIRDVTILHDTPPNSAEYYSIYGEPQSDVVELATAVSSIESIGHCPSYSYTMTTQSEAQLSNRSYDEVCVTTASTDTCMLETDGNDICWNAILTEADLGQLVDPVSYAGPVVNGTEAHLSVSDSTTTAQLTAVEPHSLHLVTSVASASSAATASLEDQELFQSGVSRHLNCLSANIPSDVISATHNVVTCVNPNITSNDWHSWPTFSTVATHDNQSATTELLIRQINSNCEQITNGMTRPSHSPIAYITTATIAARTHNGVKHINCNTNSGSSTQPDSPTSANFEHPNALQPWAECKAALEAAALDLESFGDLDSVHTY